MKLERKEELIELADCFAQYSRSNFWDWSNWDRKALTKEELQWMEDNITLKFEVSCDATQ